MSDEDLGELLRDNQQLRADKHTLEAECAALQSMFERENTGWCVKTARVFCVECQAFPPEGGGWGDIKHNENCPLSPTAGRALLDELQVLRDLAQTTKPFLDWAGEYLQLGPNNFRWWGKCMLEGIKTELIERDERVKRLENALLRLRDCDWTITLPDRMDAVREIARDALGGDTNG